MEEVAYEAEISTADEQIGIETDSQEPKAEPEDTPFDVEPSDAEADGEDNTDGEETPSTPEYDREIYELSYEISHGEGVDVNRARYAELRELGLTAREAFLATSESRAVSKDNRAHLGSSVPRGASRPNMGISARELKEARELFSGASEADILRLYKRVTAQ